MTRRLRSAVLLLGAWLLPAAALAADPVPSFAELEKAGAVIGRITIRPENIFDLDNPAEDYRLFRLANFLHVPTRASLIERRLLFRPGDRISVRLIEENERLLRSIKSLYDVEITALRYQDGVVDLSIATRDTWTLDVTASVSRAGGSNRTRLGLKEDNLFGTGVGFGVTHISDIDRTGTEFELIYPYAFDGWTQVRLVRGRFDDGKRSVAALDRPFYSLATRYAAKAAWEDVDRIDGIYNAGELAGEYRHRARNVELSGGYSPGVDGNWTQRFSGGYFGRDEHYTPAAARVPPAVFPQDSDARGLFLRYEWLEEKFGKVRNHNLIERPEYLSLGFYSRLQLSRAMESFDSSRSAWLYYAGVSKGFGTAGSQIVLASASVERRMGSAAEPMTRAAVLARYYGPKSLNQLWYASLSADAVRDGGIADQLLIGGLFGLRGYPSRYQAGENRVLATVERRLYSDWYLFRLFRLGGAAFVDAGRAWGGLNQNRDGNRWLADAGVGLRIAVDRAAFANVLHLDLATPFRRGPGVKRYEFTVKTELTF